MAKKLYGVLIHGAGWVSAQHLAAFQRNPATRVVAISSRSLVSAERRAAEAGLTDVACFDDFAKALRHPGVDLRLRRRQRGRAAALDSTLDGDTVRITLAAAPAVGSAADPPALIVGGWPRILTDGRNVAPLAPAADAFASAP